MAHDCLTLPARAEDRSTPDHSTLIAAIEARDPDAAEAMMEAHMRNIISRLDLEPLAQEVDIEDALRDTP